MPRIRRFEVGGERGLDRPETSAMDLTDAGDFSICGEHDTVTSDPSSGEITRVAHALRPRAPGIAEMNNN